MDWFLYDRDLRHERVKVIETIVKKNTQKDQDVKKLDTKHYFRGRNK